MRVAVLGASGFIGNRTVEMLHLGGRTEVRPIVRRVAGMALASRFALDCRLADACDGEALTRAFEGCDVVVHAVAGDAQVILDTLAPTFHAARQASVRRIVYLSTASVHGQAPAPGADEQSPLRDDQVIEYNNAKVRAERRLAELHRDGGVELVILRPGIVVGPRSSWIGRFADALLAGEACLVDRGRGVCNSVYVDNLVHAIDLASTAAVDGEVFLVADEDQVTWADVYRPVAEALGFALDDLPEAIVPDFSEAPRTRVDALRRSPAVRMLSRVLPRPVRAALAAALGAPHAIPADDRWTLPARRPPTVTREMALLYRCAYKLPFAKATRLLGYRPIVSFAEASERTVAWLAFAGYATAP